MKKITLITDLDNTLIYSYKKASLEKDICVEEIHGKPQGFMTQYAYELFAQLYDKVEIVPITTRSVEQYKRIKWQQGKAPRYAICANGGILLENGEINEAWLNETHRQIDKYRAERKRLEELLLKEDLYIRVRQVDDIYLFSYIKEGVDIQKKAKEYKDITPLNVIASGKKLYFFPPIINKGEATRKIKNLLNMGETISAGDSTIDVPMLNETDYRVIPNNYLKEYVKSEGLIICKDEPLSDLVLRTVKEKSDT
ncbi:MAG: HAD hydrolase family protein [Clostridia bacterium]|nr:HAD hydrolase family protein [Clostridia bacterium]